MEKTIAQQNSEQEMRTLLDLLSINEISGILMSLAAELPEDQKNFYTDEVSMWGGMGQKHVLISDIIDMVPVDSIMNVLNSTTDQVITPQM